MGMIVGALDRHSIGALVSAPPWLMFAVAALFAGALTASSNRTHTGLGCLKIAGYMVAGIACGVGLPSALPPPRSVVMTHVPALLARADIFAALEQLDERPQSLVGRRIVVSGTWHSRLSAAPAAVSRRVMACCAADAIDVGFDVVPNRPIAIADGAQVRVSGVVQSSLRDGETRYALTAADVTRLNAGSSGER